MQVIDNNPEQVARHPWGYEVMNSMQNEYVYMGNYDITDFPVTPLARVDFTLSETIIYKGIDKAYACPVVVSNEVSELEQYLAMFEAMQDGDISLAQTKLEEATSFRVPDVKIEEKNEHMDYVRSLDYLYLESKEKDSSPVVLVDPEESIVDKCLRKNIPHQIVFCLGRNKYKARKWKNSEVFGTSLVLKTIAEFDERYKGYNGNIYYGLSGGRYKGHLYGKYYGYELYPHHPGSVDYGIGVIEQRGSWMHYQDYRLGGETIYDPNDGIRQSVHSKGASPSRFAKFEGLYSVISYNKPCLFSPLRVQDKIPIDPYVLEGTISMEESEWNGYKVRKTKEGKVWDVKISARNDFKLMVMQMQEDECAWRKVTYDMKCQQAVTHMLSPHFFETYIVALKGFSDTPEVGRNCKVSEVAYARSYFEPLPIFSKNGTEMYRGIPPYFGTLVQTREDRRITSQKATVVVVDPLGTRVMSYTTLSTPYKQKGCELALTVPAGIELMPGYVPSWIDIGNRDPENLYNWNTSVSTPMDRGEFGIEGTVLKQRYGLTGYVEEVVPPPVPLKMSGDVEEHPGPKREMDPCSSEDEQQYKEKLSVYKVAAKIEAMIIASPFWFEGLYLAYSNMRQLDSKRDDQLPLRSKSSIHDDWVYVNSTSERRREFILLNSYVEEYHGTWV